MHDMGALPLDPKQARTASGAKRFESLDAMRGVAAIAVVVFHGSVTNVAPSLLSHGYLAVDFFFILSGFVIAHAYESSLRTGLSLSGFVTKRLIRLYPLALLGTLGGFAILLLKWMFFPEKVDSLTQILTSGAFNLLMLPTFFGGKMSGWELFPSNPPLWSLFFELLINFLWAAFAVSLRTTWLVVIVIAGAVGIIFCDIYFQTGNLGFDQKTFLAGFARVAFGFGMGVLLYRKRIASESVPTNGILLGAALLLALANPSDGYHITWDIVATLVLMPIIVALAAAHDMRSRMGKLLGDISYPIYVLHWPILMVASGLYQTNVLGVHPYVIGAGALVVALLSSYAALKFYDEPVRRRLSAMRGVPETIFGRAPKELLRNGETVGAWSAPFLVAGLAVWLSLDEKSSLYTFLAALVAGGMTVLIFNQGRQLISAYAVRGRLPYVTGAVVSAGPSENGEEGYAVAVQFVNMAGVPLQYEIRGETTDINEMSASVDGSGAAIGVVAPGHVATHTSTLVKMRRETNKSLVAHIDLEFWYGRVGEMRFNDHIRLRLNAQTNGQGAPMHRGAVKL